MMQNSESRKLQEEARKLAQDQVNASLNAIRFDMSEDGRYLLTAAQIGDLQASEFHVGYDSGSAYLRMAINVILQERAEGDFRPILPKLRALVQ